MRTALAAALVFFSSTMGVAPQSPSWANARAPAPLAPSAVELQTEIDTLRDAVSVEARVRREQQDDSQYFFQAVTIIVGIAALLIAIGALFATAIGYRLVRRYVEAEFTRRAGEAFEEHGKPILEDRARATQEMVDIKLTELDERFAAEVALFRAAR